MPNFHIPFTRLMMQMGHSQKSRNFNRGVPAPMDSVKPVAYMMDYISIDMIHIN